jgi:hypothetical protein
MHDRRLDDPQYWRDRAEEALVQADAAQDQELKGIWLRIAEGHKRQAELVEKLRARLEGKSSDR